MLREDITFLNHGSFGAVPRQVFDAQTEWRRRIESEPIEILGRRNLELLDVVKAEIGRTFGMKPADFGMVCNATDGINAVLQSLDLKPGDELLTTDHVYNAVRQAMKLTAAKASAVYREVSVPLPVESAREIAETVLGAITPRTRLIVIDHVTSPTALVFPVEQIIAGAKREGIDVLVDGAHVPGMIPLNVEQLGATYYAANLHKWVCAPKGSAFLWVRPDKQSRVHPTVVSHNLGEGLAREFGWQGTRDTSAWLTIPAALRFMESLGWERVMQHNHAMAAWAHRRLVQDFGLEPISPLDGSLLGSMASIRLPDKFQGWTTRQIESLQQRLYTEFKLEAPLMRWNDVALFRVACQAYTTSADIMRCCQIISELASESSS